MDKLKDIQKQLAEMRRLGQNNSSIFFKKYRDLIAQIYKEFKKINQRPPTFIEWKTMAGVDADPINRVRAAGNYPLGKNIENLERGRAIAAETMHARPGTRVLKINNKVVGVKYRNAADKKKVKDILTEYFKHTKFSPERTGGLAGVMKKLRTNVKDLKPLGDSGLRIFMDGAKKDFNIKTTLVTEAPMLHRPANLHEAILRSLTEHIRQGGTDFKYAPGGESTVFRGLKIIDNKTGDILTRASIKEAIKNKDPRFREYSKKWKELADLKKTPFIHPLTGEKMTLIEALRESTGKKHPLHLDHVRGVKTSPLTDLSIATWKANMAKKMALTTKGAEVFGVKTVVPGGTNIVGPDISFAKRQSDLTKFATDLFRKSGTREIKPARAHLKQLIDSFNASSNPQKVKTAVQLGCLAAAEGGRIGYALGSGTINCVNQKLTNEPVQSSMRLKAAEGVGKIRGAATTFLGMLGRGGAKAAPYAALAAVGAVAEPLVKQFVIDDPNTYLTNENQQKGMLLSLLEREPPKVDEEILKYEIPTLGAATAAGAIPGARELYKTRRGVGPVGPLPGVGKTRAALGLSGVLGKALGASFSPLAVAATLPISVAAQRSGGTDYGDIATDPMNWIGPAFASSGAEMASKGIKNPMLLRALRLGMSSRALMLGSRFLGLPGLALTAGMWGYDKWKGKDKDDEFKVRRYRDDEED